MLPLSFLLELFCFFFFLFYLPPFSLCFSNLTLSILWNFLPVSILKLYRNEATNKSIEGIDKNGALEPELEGLTLPLASLEGVVCHCRDLVSLLSHLNLCVPLPGAQFPFSNVGLLYPVISMSQYSSNV